MGLTGWRLVSLIGAALIGGYALATATGILLGSALPMPRSDAVMTGNLISFAVYTAAALWVFNLRKPGRAWLVLLLASMVMAAAGWTLQEHML